MTFAGDKNYVALFSHHTCSLDSFTTIYNTDYFLHLLSIETGEHIINDGLRLFKTWIITSNDHSVTLLYSFLSHYWTFAMVTITTSATYSDHFPLASEYLMNGIENIFQSIGCMGVVHNGCDTILGVDRLEPATNTMERTHSDEDVLWLFTQHASSPIDREQV